MIFAIPCFQPSICPSYILVSMIAQERVIVFLLDLYGIIVTRSWTDLILEQGQSSRAKGQGQMFDQMFPSCLKFTLRHFQGYKFITKGLDLSETCLFVLGFLFVCWCFFLFFWCLIFVCLVHFLNIFYFTPPMQFLCALVLISLV